MNSLANQPPVLGFSAYSGTGKTTLLKQLIPLLTDQGMRISVIKHVHHDFDMDTPGKDSYELRKAGAIQTLVASDRRQVLFTETPAGAEPQLHELLAQLDISLVDLVLVEGFRHLDFPRIELHRPAMGKPLLSTDQQPFVAIATDAPLSDVSHLPQLNLNDPAQISRFIMQWADWRAA